MHFGFDGMPNKSSRFGNEPLAPRRSAEGCNGTKPLAGHPALLAREDGLALLVKRRDPFQIVGAAIDVVPQLLDALEDLGRDRVGVGEHAQLLLDRRDSQAGLFR